MTLTLGAYAAPTSPRPVTAAAVVALTTVNFLVRKTALLTRIIVGLVLGALAQVITASALGGTARVDRMTGIGSGGPGGILRSAAILFFSFAGYARIATLGVS